MCEQLSILGQGMSDSRDGQNKKSETEINLRCVNEKCRYLSEQEWDVDNIKHHKR